MTEQETKLINESIQAYRNMIKYYEEMIEQLEYKKRSKQMNFKFKIVSKD
jgi:hypothetical protein